MLSATKLIVLLTSLSVNWAAEKDDKIRPDMLFGRRRQGLVYSPDPSENPSDLIQSGKFEQKVDHFNAMNTKTFSQQYLTNDQFYKPGGPLFVSISGESAMSNYWVIPGVTWMMINAEMFGAMVVELEHRFYGGSLPTPDASVDNLRLLTSEQALADLANFIVSFKKEKNMMDAKVIVFGGSYAGNLAAWFRYKYPHIADGAIASSAPVWATANFHQYYEVVGYAMKQVRGQACYDAVNEAFIEVDRMIEAGMGKQLSELFSYCRPIDTSDPLDVSYSKRVIMAIFGGAAQYNLINDFYDLGALCDIMTNELYGSPINRLAQIPKQRYYITSDGCIDNSYRGEIEELQQTNWFYFANVLGEREWLWQTCNEFGYYQGTDGTDQPFGKMAGYDIIMEAYCQDTYGLDLKMVPMNIMQTNQIYGERDLKVTNVYFPNGSLDPWHSLSILKTMDPSAIAKLVTMTPHCYDMYSNSERDPPEIRVARMEITQAIKRWIE